MYRAPPTTPNWSQCFRLRQALQVIAYGTICQMAGDKLMPPPKLSYMPDTNVAYTNDVAGTLVADSILYDCDILQSSVDASTKKSKDCELGSKFTKRSTSTP